MKRQIEQVICGNCNLAFPDTLGQPRRACPKCGSSQRHYTAHFKEKMTIGDSAEAWSTRTFYERNPLVLTIVGVISLGGPFLGFWLAGWIGVLVAFVLGVLSLFLGPFAVQKIKEIRR